MKRFLVLTFLFCVIILNSFELKSAISSMKLASQENEFDNDLSNYPLTKIELDSAKWQETTKDIDYYEKSIIRASKEDLIVKPKSKTNFDGLIPIFQIILIIIVVAILVVLVVYISRQMRQNNIHVKDDDTFWQIDLSKSDQADRILQERLDTATQNMDYTVAIRLKYLQALNELNRVNLVVWRKDKTNSDYINELQDFTQKAEFTLLTNYYENSWFGKFIPTKSTYQNISAAFSSFISHLQSTNSNQG